MRNILLAILVFGMILLAGCTQVPPPGQTTGPSAQEPAMGRVVFTIADKAADMGNVTSIKITVDEVMVHSASQGWLKVSSAVNTYDLLQLKASGYQALLADVQLANGTYEQLRLHISKVVVTDATGDHEAKLPSNDLKIVGVLEVGENSTSTVNFDFAADRSLHTTGKGEYILAPVVRLQIKEGVQVEATNRENVRVQGGKVSTDSEVGMDIDGNVGKGKEIPANAPVSIVDGVITVTPPGTNETIVVRPGSLNYQACVTKCQTGGLGGGENCIDGCKGAEGAATKDVYWCEQIGNRATVPACYGTVAKSLSNSAACDNFTGKERSNCMAAYISGSTG